MRETNMKKAISMSSCSRGDAGAGRVVHGYGARAAPVSRPDLQADGASCIHHPAGRAVDLLLGVRV